MLSTTVRTAIVFASTPRGLSASAAAINEASVGLGSRIGIVAATTALAVAALGSAREMVIERGRPTRPRRWSTSSSWRWCRWARHASRRSTTRRWQGAEPIKRAAYSVAYMDGVVVALVLSGVVGIGGAILAWVLIGRRDPIKTVFDMQDEREQEDYTPTGVSDSTTSRSGPTTRQEWGRSDGPRSAASNPVAIRPRTRPPDPSLLSHTQQTRPM